MSVHNIHVVGSSYVVTCIYFTVSITHLLLCIDVIILVCVATDLILQHTGSCSCPLIFILIRTVTLDKLTGAATRAINDLVKDSKTAPNPSPLTN